VSDSMPLSPLGQPSAHAVSQGTGQRRVCEVCGLPIATCIRNLRAKKKALGGTGGVSSVAPDVDNLSRFVREENAAISKRLMVIECALGLRNRETGQLAPSYHLAAPPASGTSKGTKTQPLAEICVIALRAALFDLEEHAWECHHVTRESTLNAIRLALGALQASMPTLGREH
jgi:hypothetical protein